MQVKKIFLISLLLIQSCKPEKMQELPFYNSPDFTPHWVAEEGEKVAATHTIAPFALKNQLGELISNETMKGKIYVANFFFTSCTSVCPMMTKNLKEIQSTFEKDPDVMLLSHSVTPWIDSPAKLKEYAKGNGINSEKWYLLTGSKQEIYTLARKSYFAEEEPGFDKDSTEFIHTENTLLIDKKGRIRGIYNATLRLEIQKIIEDIYILKKEE